MELNTEESIYEYLEQCELKDHVLLYHGTTLSSMREIVETLTFVPQKKNGSDALANHYPEGVFLDYVFFTNDLDNAGHYSTLACSNLGEYDNGDIQTIIGVMIPEYKLLPDLCDAPKTEEWKDSLKRINSVSVKGKLTLPAENLFLLYTNYDTGQPLHLTTNLDVDKGFNIAVKRLKNR